MKLPQAVKEAEKRKKDKVYTRPNIDGRLAEAIERIKLRKELPQMERDIEEHNKRMEAKELEKKKKKKEY